jgi:uncharacterized protein YbjT (DUF2867 family)
VAGVTRMYLMAPHEAPVDRAFVAGAVDRGVRHIVLLSSAGIEAMRDERLMGAERTVRESGAEWTILRPNWFNQNFDEGFFQPAVLAGELAMPLGDYRTSAGFPPSACVLHRQTSRGYETGTSDRARAGGIESKLSRDVCP